MSGERLNQLAFVRDRAHALKGETLDFIEGQKKHLSSFLFLQRLQSTPEPLGLIFEPLLRGSHFSSLASGMNSRQMNPVRPSGSLEACPTLAVLAWAEAGLSDQAKAVTSRQRQSLCVCVWGGEL